MAGEFNSTLIWALTLQLFRGIIGEVKAAQELAQTY